MSIDFEKSLTYIAKDPDWGNKLLAGSGIMLASYVLLFMPVVGLLFENLFLTICLFLFSFVTFCVLQFAILGYGCKIAKVQVDTPDEAILPNWIKDFWQLVCIGFKYTIGNILFFVPLLFVMSALAAIPFVMITGSDLPEYVLMLGIPLLFLFFILLIFLYIFTLLFLPLFSVNFMKDFKIISFINFKEGFELLRGHWGDYFIMLLLFIALACLSGTVASMLFCTIIGIVFIPILYFYTYLVFVNICAQFLIMLKTAPEKIEAEHDDNEEAPQE